MISHVQNGIIAHTDVMPLIFNKCPDLFTISKVCRLWRELVSKMPILPFAKPLMHDLFSKGITSDLLERVVNDPHALTKIFAFYLSYFSDVPANERIICAIPNELTPFSTQTVYSHLPVWKPYATALAILQSCHAKLPEDATAVDNLASLMHPHFIQEDDLLLVDDETIEIEENLLNTIIPPNIPKLYLTYDHKRWPEDFKDLHFFIKAKLTNTLRESLQYKSVPIKVALNCLEVAIDCLANKNYPEELAAVAEKFLSASSIPSLPQEIAEQFRLKAAEYTEKSKTTPYPNSQDGIDSTSDQPE